MTTATKAHTPGPWEIYAGMIVKFGETGRNICELSAAPTGLAVKHESPNHANMSEPELQANARLISQAPEMLEALELLIAQGAFPTEAYEKALAVIRKVRGGE